MILLPLLGYLGLFVGIIISYFTFPEIKWLRRFSSISFLIAIIYLFLPLLFYFDVFFGTIFIFIFGIVAGTFFYPQKNLWKLVWIATVCFFAGWLIQAIML